MRCPLKDRWDDSLGLHFVDIASPASLEIDWLPSSMSYIQLSSGGCSTIMKIHRRYHPVRQWYFSFMRAGLHLGMILMILILRWLNSVGCGVAPMFLETGDTGIRVFSGPWRWVRPVVDPDFSLPLNQPILFMFYTLTQSNGNCGWSSQNELMQSDSAVHTWFLIELLRTIGEERILRAIRQQWRDSRDNL
jgi:hypothetical protein